MKALYRLMATTTFTVNADSSVEPSEWWQRLPAEQKKEYIEQHPNSKYADQAIKEGQEKGHEAPEHLKPDSAGRKKVAEAITSNAPKIAEHLKKTFPKMSHAVGALKSLATGKKLDHHQKEVLHELGELALHNAASKYIGGTAVHYVADIGITAVKYGIEKYKEKQAANKDKDSVEAFVEAVGEGATKSEHAPVPEEHAKAGSNYRKALGAHLKANANHVTEVLNRSFPNIKPASEGLIGLTQKKPLNEEQKKAVKSLGKQALMLSIAALPGGLAAHLTAGVSASVISYGIKKVRAAKAQGNNPKSVVHHFVESIGEGLEHAFYSGHLGGGHEGGSGGGGGHH